MPEAARLVLFIHSQQTTEGNEGNKGHRAAGDGVRAFPLTCRLKLLFCQPALTSWPFVLFVSFCRFQLRFLGSSAEAWRFWSESRPGLQRGFECVALGERSEGGYRDADHAAVPEPDPEDRIVPRDFDVLEGVA